MKVDIKIPLMGESISEVTIGQILKTTGSWVKVDEEILELETDKVNQVIYASQSGRLTLNISQDDVVKIHQVIGAIEVEERSENLLENNEEKNTSQAMAKKNPPVIASPEKARFFKEDFVAEVNANDKTPRALEGRLKETASLQENSPTLSLHSKNETRRKMSKIRKMIAQRLVEAQHTTAMLTTFNEVDLSQVIALREKHKESFIKAHQTKLGFMSFFVHAAVSALKAFPDLNSYIDGEEIVRRHYYDIGIAVGTERGLVVPVVRGCDHLSFSQIELEIEKLAKKAREGGLSVDDLQGGGFTITNGGTYGSLLSTPIINFPQSAILGMHKIEKRAVVINDEIVIRPMMYLALSYDHRLIDGKESVSFLVHIKNLLEDPSRMLLEV